MPDRSPHIPCPSCGAILEDHGHCPYCGGQARGFWNELDLGTPELASAVAQGLDYYLALGLQYTDSHTSIAEAYRLARQRYPDDPRSLLPLIARHLGLIEEAWRILGDPQRRAVYDRLCGRRETTSITSEVRTLRCANCGDPYEISDRRCPSCGSLRTVEAVPAIEHPIEDIPDYYHILGLAPKMKARRSEPQGGFKSNWSLWHQAFDEEHTPASEYDRTRPDQDDIDLGYLRRLQELSYHPDPTAEEDLEVARRVLSDPARWEAYDRLRQQIQEARQIGTALRALTTLDQEVRAELQRRNFQQVNGARLLAQGRGYFQLGLFTQAVPILEQTCTTLPNSAEAHALLGRALWGNGDVFQLAPYVLRRVERAWARAIELDASLATDLERYRMVARGVLAYNEGDLTAADREFVAVTTTYPDFFPAWRMHATVLFRQEHYDQALLACAKALQIDQRSEPVLLLAAAICHRLQQPARAYELATRIATLRDRHTRAEDVLREIGA